MEEAMKLNVLITTYNHADYVKDAINGALNQKTTFDYNIVIHDDASTDGTQNILKHYKNKYPEKIILVLQDKNIKSRGINRFPYIKKFLTGKYLAICEGDDYWISSNKLQKQVDFLENNSSYYAVYHNVLTVDENDAVLPLTQHIYYYRYEADYTYDDTGKNKLPGQTASCLSRNYYLDLVENSEYFNDFYAITSNGDQRNAFLFSLKGNVKVMEGMMAVHRKITAFGDSWSARINGKNLKFMHYQSLIDYENFAKKHYGITISNRNKKIKIHLAAYLRYIKNKTQENHEVLQKIRQANNEYRIKLLAYWMAIIIIALFKKPLRVLKNKICKLNAKRL